MSCEQSWVEVEGGAIRRNLEVFRRRVGPDVRIGAVVKSEAYGHGLEAVARLTEGRADWLCVDGLDEAVRLRTADETRPILVMGHIPPGRLAEVVELGEIRPVLYNLPDLERLSAAAEAAGAVVPVHVKAETGTHRQGLAGADLVTFADRVRALPGVRLEGVSMHFADIEDTTDHAFARRQHEMFDELCRRTADGDAPPIRHAACSAAALLLERTHLELVRVGISLYGVWPSKETYVSCLQHDGHPIELSPALTWKTRIAQVKHVPEGAFVGYGRTWRATRDSRIAVLPIGYYEGYDRRLSNTGHALVAGRRAPIRGRVCMNMCMVDVTDIPDVAAEDEVVLLGRQGDERVRAEDLAAWCGTIPYEILARIHPAIRRTVVESGDRKHAATS